MHHQLRLGVVQSIIGLHETHNSYSRILQDNRLSFDDVLEEGY